jgi:hypothetical protein
MELQAQPRPGEDVPDLSPDGVLARFAVSPSALLRAAQLDDGKFLQPRLRLRLRLLAC